uniref:VWFA domain-containing protein n=1 Tax=Eptatretus burgeri TaxID=7764 RepID=A0A8C4WW31_EPTBU
MTAWFGACVLIYTAIIALHSGMATATAGCSGERHDILILLDGSSAMGQTGFTKARRWVLRLTGALTASHGETRVGLVTFGASPHLIFTPGQHVHQRGLHQAIRRTRFLGDGTARVGNALEFVARQEVWGPSNDTTGRVAIVVMASRSQDRVMDGAQVLHAAGVWVYAVGIGSVPTRQLLAVASEPHSDHVWRLKQIGQLPHLVRALQQSICYDAICQNLEVDEKNGPGKLLISGFDLMQHFWDEEAFKGPEGGFPVMGLPLAEQTRKVFPRGMPDEFTLVTVFRMSEHTRQNIWYLWQVLDRSGIPQVAVCLDGAKRMLAFEAAGVQGAEMLAISQHPAISLLFDGGWHRLEVTVTNFELSLQVDCKPAGSQPLSQRAKVDMDGVILLGILVKDRTAVHADFLKFALYCGSRNAGRERCCSVPGQCDGSLQSDQPIPNTQMDGQEVRTLPSKSSSLDLNFGPATISHPGVSQMKQKQKTSTHFFEGFELSGCAGSSCARKARTSNGTSRRSWFARRSGADWSTGTFWNSWIARTTGIARERWSCW